MATANIAHSVREKNPSEKQKKRKFTRLVKERKISGFWETGPGSLGPRLKILGYNNYSSYLSGTHWRSLREFYIDERGISCTGECGRDGTQLHHKTYERLGKELLDDLVLLCSDCHSSLHKREHMAIKGGMSTALRRIIKQNKKSRGIRVERQRQHKRDCRCGRCPSSHGR
jgi:hypothetical protein